jgi:hypothetical protein
MTNLYCLYWVPGSCGDILQHVLSFNPDVCTGATFTVNAQGRAFRRMNQDFLQIFPAESRKWLMRTWSTEDCNQLIKLSKSKTVVIGTHRYDQVKFLKDYLGNNIETVGVVYERALWPFVLKNYCVKVQDSDPESCYWYQQQNEKLYQTLKKNNAFGAWVLQDQLLTKREIATEVNELFDHNIFLNRLLLGDLQWIDQFKNPQSAEQFDQWLNLQSLLYRIKLPDNRDFTACLGRNCEAYLPNNNPIWLDEYDRMFVKHYVKTHNLPQCHAQTHYELLDFFEVNKTIITNAH